MMRNWVHYKINKNKNGEAYRKLPPILLSYSKFELHVFACWIAVLWPRTITFWILFSRYLLLWYLHQALLFVLFEGNCVDIFNLLYTNYKRFCICHLLSFRFWFVIDRRTHLSYGFRPLGSFQACNQLHTTIYLGKQHHMQHLCLPMRVTILSMPPHSLLMCHSPVCIILLSPPRLQTLTTWFISSCQAWVEMWGLALLPLDLKLERINHLNWATLIGPQISELLSSLDVFMGMEVV